MAIGYTELNFVNGGPVDSDYRNYGIDFTGLHLAVVMVELLSKAKE